MSRVPVVDVSNLEEDAEALARLDAACRDFGFFYVQGHGIDSELQQAVLEQTQAFFAQPSAEKQRVLRSDTNVWGFYDRELTKNVRDWKEIFDVGPPESQGPVAGAEPQWPARLPAFEGTMQRFIDASRALAHRLIAGIGKNLGASPQELRAAFLPVDSSFLRLNYYPVCEDPAPADAPTWPVSGHLGIHHHTDAGALTVLLQDDQPGLQTYHDDAWHLIEPLPGSLVINIGDIVQVWSNDTYRAPVHRVIASSDIPRYSIPFFFNPSYATDYAPLPSVVAANGRPLYQPINWGEFRAARAAGDYADYGAEIQISDFRI